MFTTLLSNLATYISSRFIVANFFPMLAFWFFHALTLYEVNDPFRAYAATMLDQSTGMATLVAAVALIGVAVTAYAEAALLPSVQSAMEGNWPLWLGWLVQLFTPSQMREFERLSREIRQNNKARGSLQKQIDGEPRIDHWKNKLSRSRRQGCVDHAHHNTYRGNEESASRVNKLAHLRRRSRPIPSEQIDEAVDALSLELEANDADTQGPNENYALEATRQFLWDIIEYARQYADAQYRSLITQRHFRFGELPLAPTRMGNVARTVQSYAVNRYNLNFELLWSRLQFVAQKDKDFGPLLQGAKTQLDFLTSCSVLSLLWSVPWAVWFYASDAKPGYFLAAVLAGPLAAYVWYRIAVAQYAALAALLRTSVDLFRFDLLTALHYPTPGDADEERELWENIDAMHARYEGLPMRYTNPKAAP